MLTGDIAAGYMQRNYADPRLGSIGGPIGSGSLFWTADALNTGEVHRDRNHRRVDHSDVPGVLSRDIGLQYDHAFRLWLIGTVKAGFGTDLYPNDITASLGARRATASTSAIRRRGRDLQAQSRWCR